MLRTETYSKSSAIVSKVLSTDIGYTLWGVFLLVLCTQISIPLEPVPITLQTVGVLLIGLTFTRKIALQSVALYLALGLAGAPVFTHFSGGFYKLMGPTGGYLIGFFMAVLCMTTLRQYLNPKNGFYIALNCVIGTLVIYSFGIAWLAHLIGFNAAIKGGLMPFVLSGGVKIVLLALAVRYLKPGHA